MPICSICDQEVEGWLPHPHRDTISPLMGMLDVIGSDLEFHLCPRCRSNDRERHIWIYMAALGILAESVGKPILHIAPEGGVEHRLRAGAGPGYLAGDLHPRNPLHARIDVEHLDHPDGSFHLIICNHVLEHVSDADRAIAELARCLSRNGWLVAQTPYSTVLRDTMEFTSPPSPQVAEFFLGQDDHVRLFGANIADLFLRAGLKGELYPHAQLMPSVDGATYGVNVREPFFLFSKSRALKRLT
jgi:SAM-dependent methyltransferase